MQNFVSWGGKSKLRMKHVSSSSVLEKKKFHKCAAVFATTVTRQRALNDCVKRLSFFS